MTHPTKTELEQFITGKLAAARLLEVDEHISSCSECREAVNAIPAGRKSALDMGAMLLGAQDCPDYEELSAYVDRELDSRRTAEISAHVNLCEPCTRDVSRIAELRSHAAMRPTITVGPGMSRQAARVVTPIWKRVLAGVSAAAVVAVGAVAFNAMLNTSPTATPSGSNVAKVERHSPSASGPSVPGRVAPGTGPKVAVNGGSDKTPGAPVTVAPDKPSTQIGPKPAVQAKALIKDGKYQVTEQNGEMVLAKAGVGTPRTALEAKIAAAINQKLKSGKITVTKPVQLAMAAITVRGSGPFKASPMAPKLISPAGKMLITDQPTLTWSKVSGANSYRVTIFDEAGRDVLTQVTDKTSLALPSALNRGQVYMWRVQVRFAESDEWSEDVTPSSAAAKFGVLSANDYASIRQLQKDAPGSHLALGAAYESFGLTDEAHHEYAAVRAANPGSKLAGKLR